MYDVFFDLFIINKKCFQLKCYPLDNLLSLFKPKQTSAISLDDSSWLIRCKRVNSPLHLFFSYHLHPILCKNQLEAAKIQPGTQTLWRFTASSMLSFTMIRRAKLYKRTWFIICMIIFQTKLKENQNKFQLVEDILSFSVN